MYQSACNIKFIKSDHLKWALACTLVSLSNVQPPSAYKSHILNRPINKFYIYFLQVHNVESALNRRHHVERFRIRICHVPVGVCMCVCVWGGGVAVENRHLANGNSLKTHVGSLHNTTKMTKIFGHCFSASSPLPC